MLDIQELLNKVYKKVKKNKGGKNASYIPELAKADPNTFGISLVDCTGYTYSVGDHKQDVAIESISKLFTLALATETQGIQAVFDKIGVHGSFLSFNSVMAADMASSHTINPFVNQGAMATTSMLYKDNKQAFFRDIHDNMCAYASRKLPVGQKVYRSEGKTNARNLALAYLLKSYDRFYGDNVQKSVDVYTKQCSVMINSDNLATMAAVFAAGGVHPETKRRLIGQKETDFILHTLRSEGLYQYSDVWTAKCGVPAKSGVGGGLLIVIPGICGIGIVSPPLDENGNSVRGIAAGLELVNSIKPSTFGQIEQTCKLIPNSRCLLLQNKKTRTQRVRKRKKKSKNNI